MKARSNWRTLTVALLCGALVVGGSDGLRPTMGQRVSAQVDRLVVSEAAIAPNVAALIQTLKNTKGDDRLDIWYALMRMGKPAIPALSQLLQDNDPEIQGGAAAAIILMGDIPETLEPKILELLAHPEEVVRASVGVALIDAPEVSQKLRPKLIPLLSSTNEETQYIVADILSNASDAVIPELLPLLQHPDPVMRSGAVLTLGKVKYSQTNVVPDLIPLLRDRSLPVRFATVEAISRFNSSITISAIPDLITVLKDDASLQLRCRSADVLGQMGANAATAIPTLRSLLKDASPALRSASAVALGDIGRASNVVVPDLLPLLQDTNARVRESATRALNKLGYKP
jgi:HEAT repeat protein